MQIVYVTGRDNNMCFSQGCEIPMESSVCCTVRVSAVHAVLEKQSCWAVDLHSETINVF